MRKFISALNEEDLRAFFPLIKELRPHLSVEEYLEIYKESHLADHYQITALIEGDNILGLMGHRILSDLVRGKHIYIDDLIVNEKYRSQGVGRDLLLFAEELARKEDIKTLRLCVVLENERGINFYEKNGWAKRAYAYTKKIS